MSRQTRSNRTASDQNPGPSAAPRRCRAAVFVGPNKPLEMQTFAIPQELPDGAALCRVRLSTICGSDLHTTRGRRQEPMPSILGHESVGEVVRTGGPVRDGIGQTLRIGDRVTWTIMASCGKCFFCNRQLPQKCVHLLKYGHLSCDTPPGLTGGYGEYIYLYPGTTLFRVPDDLEDTLVAPANCALATVVNAMETIGMNAGESVLIQGMGLLGLYLAVLVREAGADRVLVTDCDERRLEMASRFGANAGLNVTGRPADEVVEWVRDNSGDQPVDVAFEVCGHPDGAVIGMNAVRIGGRLLIAGLVTPASRFETDGNQLTRKCLTVKGIHNYRPEQLGRGLRFLERQRRKYPFRELASEPFPLAEINEAFNAAERGEHVRVSVRCTSHEPLDRKDD